MFLYSIYSKHHDAVVYVGITSHKVRYRYVRHLCSSRVEKPKTVIERAIKKYGEDNFECFTIGHADDWESLAKMERNAIKLFGTNVKDGGYNVAEGGGGGNAGWKHTTEAKARIVAAVKARPGGMLGKHHSEETKKRLSEEFSGENHPNFGKKRPPEVGRKISLANLGHIHSDEAREKISRGLKDKPKSDAHRAALSKASKGKPKSEAHKAALKAAWERRRSHNA